MELTPMMRFQMSGVGYGHPRFRHGTWVGESVVETERTELAAIDPTSPGNFHVQHLVRAVSGDRRGVGVLEVIILGPHAATGLQSLGEVAPLR